MRYATFSLSTDPAPRLGIVTGERIVDASSVASSLVELIARGPAAWAAAAAFAVAGRGLGDAAPGVGPGEDQLEEAPGAGYAKRAGIDDLVAADEAEAGGGVGTMGKGGVAHRASDYIPTAR